MAMHEMRLNPAPFALIRDGRKTIELRIVCRGSLEDCVDNPSGVLRRLRGAEPAKGHGPQRHKRHGPLSPYTPLEERAKLFLDASGTDVDASALRAGRLPRRAQAQPFLACAAGGRGPAPVSYDPQSYPYIYSFPVYKKIRNCLIFL